MTDEARTALMIVAWLVSLALAFAAGWVWRNGRIHESGEPGVTRAFGIDADPDKIPTVLRAPADAIASIEVVRTPPGGLLIVPDTMSFVELDGLAPGEIPTQVPVEGGVPVRGSHWESELDWERRQGAAQARADRS